MQAEAGLMRPQAKESLEPPKLEKAREDSPLETTEGVQPANTLLLDFWPSELGENKFLF